MTSSSGADRRRGAQVSLGADPIEGESLPGFVMRLARRQRMTDAGRLTGMVGLRQPGSSVVACDLGELSRRAGTQVAALEAIAYRPAIRPGHNAFLGGVINREFIDISRRRACPRCLGESPHHRAVWDCALVTACPDHLVRLLDGCPRCPRHLGWRRPNLVRCACRADLTAFTGLPVSAQEAEATGDVVALISRQHVPWLGGRLAACDRADLLRLLMCLGMFLTDWRRERRIETLVAAGPDSVARVVLAGLDALKRWPEPLQAYLADQRIRAGQRRGRYGARKTLGAFYDWLTLMEDGEVRAVLAEAARDFIQRDPQLAHRVHRSRLLSLSDPAPGGVLALADAARCMGRSGETVKRMMTAGMLPTAASEGRGVPMALDGKAVEALGSQLRRAVPLVEAARLLGISRARARRLAEAGLIRPVQRAVAGGWAHWAFDPVEIEGFLERLSAGTSGLTSSTRTVGFNHVAEALRRRGVALERMVHLILDGDLAVLGHAKSAGFGGDHRAIPASPQEMVGLKRLRFDPAIVRNLCRGLENGPVMTIEAAAEQLGLKWQVAAHLVRAGLLDAVDGGVVPASVERFAADYVTGATLARERRTSPRSLARKLAEQGIFPVVGPRIDGSRQNVYRRDSMHCVKTRGGEG